MKYTVYLFTYANTSVEVEADNRDEAITAALESDMPTICAPCSGWGSSGPSLALSDVWDIAEVTGPRGELIEPSPEAGE